MLHLFLHVCVITEQNCHTCPALTDINQGNHKTSGACVWYIRCRSLPSYLCVIPTEVILYQLSVYIIYCTLYCDCIIKWYPQVSK